ncbi:MAG TPA: prepilin-type N-terminal cleavage/methylation domain-containing protein [Candidatus Eisenbacteria bacterium]|jgi:prepilin-type N-terminal cleavage/methylation domain-containing protein|nr:prepilin-type N-terminal cleavage/methylation domain-containing protein [Candidatus Eisenbacteria bacterium]
MPDYKNFKKRREEGFTLLEIMIVLIIIGVLAALAIPIYVHNVEQSYKQEAYMTLTVVRESQLRYHTGHNAYSSAYSLMDYDPTDTTLDPPGMVRHFDYAAPTAAAATWSVVATRNASGRGAGVPAYTVTIDQTGAITSSY